MFDHGEAINILAGSIKEGFLPESDVWQLLAAYGLPIVLTVVSEAKNRLLR